MYVIIHLFIIRITIRIKRNLADHHHIHAEPKILFIVPVSAPIKFMDFHLNIQRRQRWIEFMCLSVHRSNLKFSNILTIALQLYNETQINKKDRYIYLFLKYVIHTICKKLFSYPPMCYSQINLCIFVSIFLPTPYILHRYAHFFGLL